jgi:hypothetical protein
MHSFTPNWNGPAGPSPQKLSKSTQFAPNFWRLPMSRFLYQASRRRMARTRSRSSRTWKGLPR